MKKIVGVESVNYQSKSGNQVSGVRIHIESSLQSPHVGCSVSSEFINGGVISDYPLGEVTAILYEPAFGGKYRCVGAIYKK